MVDLWFFFINQLPLGPWYTPFSIWLRICEENRLWNRRFSSPQCQWHRCDKKRFLVSHHTFSVKVICLVICLVQDNLLMFVFSIDIPFTGSQSLLNMRSKVIAVSYTHSGVIYTALHVTAVSMTPLCMSQRCQWHHCAYVQPSQSSL
jgi:hypothetical protein